MFFLIVCAFIIVFLALYFGIGLALAVPYNWLAGGNDFNYYCTAAIFPVAIGSLIIIYLVESLNEVKLENGKETLKKPSLKLTWFFTFYFLVPVIFNGISILLKNTNYEVFGDYLFGSRYLIMWTVPVYIFMVHILPDLFQSNRHGDGSFRTA